MARLNERLVVQYVGDGEGAVLIDDVTQHEVRIPLGHHEIGEVMHALAGNRDSFSGFPLDAEAHTALVFFLGYFYALASQ